MAEIDPVILQLRTDVARYNADVRNSTRLVQTSLSQQERSVLSLENQMRNSSGAITGSISRIGTSITGLAAGVSLLALSKQFLDVADASKSLDAQLRLATNGFGSFAQAQEDVRRISADARAGLEDTAALYGSFTRTSQEIGRSQEEAAVATETFTKALKVGGAGAAQVQSATLQLGQALASTNVQWEELGQILEASPRLARVFTDSLGITRQELKKMAEDGKLTGEMLFNALNNQEITRGLDAEFAKLPVTFEDAMQSVSNAAIITFGAFDRGGQFSTALANFVTQGSEGFGDLEKDAFDLGVSIRSSLEGLADVFDPLFQAAKSTFAFIRDSASGASDFLKQKTGASIGVEGLLYNVDSAAGLVGVNTGLLDTYRTGRDRSEARLRGAQNEQAVNDIINQYFDRNGNSTRTTPRRAAATGSSDADRKNAAAAARKAENERLRAIREDASNARDSARLQDEINAAKSALATATEDVLAYNLQAIDNEQAQRTAEYETQRKLGRISDQELADRTKAVAEIAGLQRQRVQRIADENQRRDDLDRYNASLQDNSDLLRAQADLVTTREQRRDIELRLLDLSYEQERAELEAVRNSETASAAQKEIAEQRLRILDQLKGYEVERTNRQYESPLEQRRRQVRETAGNINDAVENIELDAIDNLTDGLANASTEFIKLGGVAGDVLNSIISGFVKLAAQQAIFGTGGIGSGGGLLGSIGGLLGIKGARAAGGPVSAGQTYLVGEEGPELFRAPSNGTIVPNHQINTNAAASMSGVRALPTAGGGVTVLQTIQLHAEGAVMTPDLLNHINTMAQQAAVEGAKGGRALAAQDLKAASRSRM